MEVLILILIGLAAGTLGSLLGLGGGFLVVPALMLLLDKDPKMASGTAIAVIVPTMLVALWRRGAQGHIDFPLAGQIAIGAVAGAGIGSWLAGFLPAVVIRRTFAIGLGRLAALLFFKKESPPVTSPEATPSGAGDTTGD